MSRFGSLCILLLTALLMLLTVMACSEEDSAPLTPATAPSSATASPAATTPEPTATPSLITIDCNDPRFTKQILELSEGNQNQFSPRILKLYSDAEEIERTESVLRCRGTATLSRGGESNITYHYEIDRDGDAFIGYEIGDPIATPTPATSPSPGFTLDNPLPAGELLQGSDGTETRVLGVVEDARRQVAEENQFNDPPQEGKRFYMVSVEVSYPSGSSSITVSDTDFSLIGENRVVYDSFDYDCGVIPNELDGEVYGGGRIQGNICFEIPEDEGGFILIHEPGYEADSRRFLRLPYSAPVQESTAEPTLEPTAAPEPTPPEEPTSVPTSAPVQESTAEPTLEPTAAPEPTPASMTVEEYAKFCGELRGADPKTWGDVEAILGEMLAAYREATPPPVLDAYHESRVTVFYAMYGFAQKQGSSGEYDDLAFFSDSSVFLIAMSMAGELESLPQDVRNELIAAGCEDEDESAQEPTVCSGTDPYWS